MAIGIALIGSGIFAREAHLPAIQATPILSLKAVYSRSLASAKALAEGLEGVELYAEDREGYSYEELLKRDDVKALVIALPIPVQPTYIKSALTANKHVFAEKPIAKDVATAKDLLSFYDSLPSSKPSFSIAENFRFMDSFVWAAEQVKALGRPLQFRTRMHAMVQPGSKYYETSWRKTPSYQGGFLLDGGVHFIAATRLMLGAEHEPVLTSAVTAQLQPHLPPLDTVDAVLWLKSGGSGTLSISFGTTFSGSEYAVACEKGTVVRTFEKFGKVVVKKDGKEVESKEFPDEENGVNQEIKAWAEALEKGTPNPLQSPEQALADLALLEGMLESGKKNGEPVTLA